MPRLRIAGLLTGVSFVVLGAAIVAPSAAAASSPVASPPAASSLAASPADTGGYPAQGPMLTLSSGSVNVGGSVIVNGRGFQSGESVDISVTYPAGSHALGSGGPVAQPAALSLRRSVGRTVTAAHALATQDGQFSTKISLTQAGNATVTATGEQSHLSLTATLTVLSRATGGASKSTKSGFPLSRVELLILALALIALLLPAGIARWRRSRKPSALDPVSSGIGVS
jgi:hypothetical protein